MAQRLRLVAEHAELDEAALEVLGHASGLPAETADGLVENAVGSFPLPLGFAVGFVIDGDEVVVPMAVEESSVIAAASHGAKLAAAGGGFRTDVDDPITIGQIEVRDVPDVPAALRTVDEQAPAWITSANRRIRSMVERGGGVRDIQGRHVPDPAGGKGGKGDRVVVHLHVDCRDAMGANLVNDLCEFLAPAVTEACGGSMGLRILSNLASERLATATCMVPAAALGGPDVVAAMVAANRFAELDPYRAATHNKGILNGIDPVVIATGNDWRAVEAGAHAYAAVSGHYRALTQYDQTDAGDLQAVLRLPLSVGTVGGVTRVHPVAAACLQVLGSPDARRLAGIMAAVGLAQNLSALRALATEGIQRGHMELHARNLAMQAGLTGEAAARAAAQMVLEGAVSAARARQFVQKE